MVELAGVPRPLLACIGKLKSDAASRCVEGAATAASGESCRAADAVGSSQSDPELSSVEALDCVDRLYGSETPQGMV